MYHSELCSLFLKLVFVGLFFKLMCKDLSHFCSFTCPILHSERTTLCVLIFPLFPLAKIALFQFYLKSFLPDSP